MSSRWSSIRGRLCLPAGGRLVAGFFPRNTRGGAYNEGRKLVSKYKEYNIRGWYLLSPHTDKASPFSLSTTLGLGRICSRLASPLLKGVRPRLLCKKLKRVRSEPNEKSIKLGMLSTLGEIIKNQEACNGQEEVVLEEF